MTDSILLERETPAHPYKLRYFPEPNIARCPMCKCTHHLGAKCACGLAYCSIECRSFSELRHLPECPAFTIDYSTFEVTGRSHQSRLGRAGLDNIGLTCYMNSSLQCLSNVTPLKEYFLSMSFKQDVNTTGVFSSKGQVVARFAEVLDMLWNQAN